MALSSVPVVTVDALAARVADGAMLAVPPDYSFVAMTATRALIRRGARGLHLLAVPQSGIQADMLIGAGCGLGVKRLMLTEQKAVMAALTAGMLLLAVLFLIPTINELIIGFFWFLLKVMLIIYTFIWYRGTFPRYRYDQLMDVSWRYLIPISIGALIVNAFVLLVVSG